MNLFNKLEQDFKTAYKAGDKMRIDLLRMVKAALKNEMINIKKQELTDEEVLKILKKEAHKRQDSIELYHQGNRPEMAETEQAELKIIQEYLPEQMSEADIKKIVESVVSEMGQISPSQFGAVMGNVMAKTKGQADGAVVSKVVKSCLNK